jgi:hypothetical protein
MSSATSPFMEPSIWQAELKEAFRADREAAENENYPHTLEIYAIQDGLPKRFPKTTKTAEDVIEQVYKLYY